MLKDCFVSFLYHGHGRQGIVISESDSLVHVKTYEGYRNFKRDEIEELCTFPAGSRITRHARHQLGL